MSETSFSNLIMNKSMALPFSLPLQLCRKDESPEEVWKPPGLV